MARIDKDELYVAPSVQSVTFTIPPDRTLEVFRYDQIKSRKVFETVGQENLAGYSLLELDAICDELHTQIKRGKFNSTERKMLKDYYNNAAMQAKKQCGFKRYNLIK